MSPFPKLDARIVRSDNHHDQPGSVSRPVARGTVIIEGGYGQLPEMATDVIDTSASYAVENVKRERSKAGPWPRLGLGYLVGRMLGSHRAAPL
ncbi:MAG TPA: hypothetical protein VL486_15695 [Verrucomicrobiae bacterium]|nr:hypothetical protein [Verrucomicrobiae bacterium]